MTPPLHSLNHRLHLACSCFRVAFARLSGVRIGPGVLIGPRCDVALGRAHPQRGTLSLGARSRLDCGVTLHPWEGSILIGENTYLGPYTLIYGHGGVSIGSDCLIAGHTCIASANHAIPPLGSAIHHQPDTLLPTRIGNDVWIGFGAVILGGITVGDGAIVGAGSVVTHDLPPGAIAAGNPARILRHRD